MERALQYSAAMLAAILTAYVIASCGFGAAVKQSMEEWQLQQLTSPAGGIPFMG